MAALVEHVACKHEDLSSVPQTHEKAGHCGIVARPYNPTTGQGRDRQILGACSSQRMLFGELLAHGRSFLRHKNVVW